MLETMLVLIWDWDEIVRAAIRDKRVDIGNMINAVKGYMTYTMTWECSVTRGSWDADEAN